MSLGSKSSGFSCLGQISDIPYAGTARGLVSFSCDKCNYKVSHWDAFAVSWKAIYLNTSNLAVKARYSFAFSVKFSIKSERFHPYRGWPFISVIYLLIYKFRIFVFLWRVPPWEVGESLPLGLSLFLVHKPLRRGELVRIRLIWLYRDILYSYMYV